MVRRVVVLAALLAAGCRDGREADIRRLGAGDLGTERVVLQRTRSDCGDACLAMVCRGPNARDAVARVLGRTPRGPRGLTLLALKDAAERLGFIATGWRTTSAGLRAVRRPAILFVRGNHYVVLDSVTQDGSVFLRDPAIGRIFLRAQRLTRIWKGEVLELAPRTPAGGRDTSASVHGTADP